MNLLIVFLTGLTTGGLTCLAMQGGLLASVITNQKREEIDESKKLLRRTIAPLEKLDLLPVLMFLAAKLISHTILGLLLGLLGSYISLTLEARLAFQVFTAAFMFATAMNLLNVHPIFRYVVFQPPKFMQRWVRNSTKSRALFSPAILGLMTIFIPCGVTQVMEVAAINSGNPIQGALIMFSFVLGTSPLFLLVGIATAKLSSALQQKFLRFAAYSLVLMALYFFNGVLVALDFPITAQKLTRPISYFFSDDRFNSSTNTVVEDAGVQKVTIDVQNNGYSPSYFKVKQGVPVELTVQSNGVYSCAAAFTFREFNIATFLKSTDRQTFTFIPTKKGTFTYACSMGMYTGRMEVI